MKAILCLLLTLVSASFTLPVQADKLRETFDRISPSVVKVTTTDTGHAATGFVWQASNLVVTSLHVVDGSQNIIVEYESGKITRRPAQVERVLQSADLVLLRIENPPAVTPLPSSAVVPAIDARIHALGYSLNFDELNSFSFTQRYGGRRLADNISPKLTQKLRQSGYPDPDMEVVKLGNDSLLPGLSGAPIVDQNGVVVAIGNGGLEEGALNISWGIPASHLTALASSSVRSLPGSTAVKELFSAELDANMGTEIVVGNNRLIKVRTRSLAELMSTADDQLGLSQLTTFFAMLDPMQFRYDIYQSADTGATLVVPEGSQLHPVNGSPWQVKLPFSNLYYPVFMYVQSEQTNSLNHAQMVSVNFENWLGMQHADVQWMPDPSWSYLEPYTRFDGLIVNRKAFFGESYGGMSKYGFETLASRNLTFLGVAGIRGDILPQDTYGAQLCLQIMFQDPECQSMYNSVKAWAHVVIGLQLSGFSL